MALEHTKQTAYVGTHAQHDHSTHTHRNTHSYSRGRYWRVWLHGCNWGGDLCVSHTCRKLCTVNTSIALPTLTHPGNTSTSLLLLPGIHPWRFHTLTFCFPAHPLREIQKQLSNCLPPYTARAAACGGLHPAWVKGTVRGQARLAVF